jgi:hypothetical protein
MPSTISFFSVFCCDFDSLIFPRRGTCTGYRNVTDGRFSTAKTLVPQCLDMCDVLTIRRFFRKAWRYMDAYRYIYHCFRVIMWQR